MVNSWVILIAQYIKIVFSFQRHWSNNGPSPYTETIDLCFEPCFVKEIRRVIE